MKPAIREPERHWSTMTAGALLDKRAVDTDYLVSKESDFGSQEISNRTLVDAMRSAAYTNAWQTLAYQWRGQDTLTLGSPLSWIWAKLTLKAFEPRPTPSYLDPVARLHGVIENLYLSEAESLFQLRRPEQVHSYLRDNRELNAFLVECYIALKRYFGAQAAYILELVHDPEDGEDRLFVYVRTTLSVDDAMHRLDSFDNDWYLKQDSDLMGRIGINLEFA